MIFFGSLRNSDVSIISEYLLKEFRRTLKRNDYEREFILASDGRAYRHCTCNSDRCRQEEEEEMMYIAGTAGLRQISERNGKIL